MKGGLRICDPCHDEQWKQLTDQHGHLFISQAWMRVLRDGYGLRPEAAMQRSRAAGFAWVEVDDLKGRRLLALPFSDFADFAGDVDADWMRGVLKSGNGKLPMTVRLRVTTDRALESHTRAAARSFGLQVSGRLAWHWADIDPAGSSGPHSRSTYDVDDDALWKGLASGARQNIRRSRRAGVRVTVHNDVEAMQIYHRLHRDLRRSKYRLLAQPKPFFDAIHDHFGPSHLAVVLAWVVDEPVAGVVLLRHRDWAYYKLNASNSAGWSCRANDAVMWGAMNQARRWGCRWFDFGVSDLDQPGLIRYKNKYSSGQGEVVVLRRQATATTWSQRSVDRLLPAATRLFTSPRCPDLLGESASRWLYPMFC